MGVNALVSRVIARSVMTALLLLSWSAGSLAADTYDPVTHRLTIPWIFSGSETYYDVVVAVSGITLGPATSAPPCGDTYDAATNRLSVAAALVADKPYYNVSARVDQVISVGGVTGGDSYDHGVLTVGSVLYNGKVYHDVVLTVAAVNDVLGGMPAGGMDLYAPPPANTLTIPAVQVGGSVYTNVVVTPGKVLSVGSGTGIQNPPLNGSFAPLYICAISAEDDAYGRAYSLLNAQANTSTQSEFPAGASATSPLVIPGSLPFVFSSSPEVTVTYVEPNTTASLSTTVNSSTSSTLFVDGSSMVFHAQGSTSTSFTDPLGLSVTINSVGYGQSSAEVWFAVAAPTNYTITSTITSSCPGLVAGNGGQIVMGGNLPLSESGTQSGVLQPGINEIIMYGRASVVGETGCASGSTLYGSASADYTVSFSLAQ